MTHPPIVQRVDVLESIATRIHAEFAVAETNQRQALTAYRTTGQELIRAKEICGHGKWREWFDKQRFRFGYMQATRYMRLAKSNVTLDLEQWRIISGNDEPGDEPGEQPPEPIPQTPAPGNSIDFDASDSESTQQVDDNEPEQGGRYFRAHPVHNHRAQGTGLNEWYTPPDVLDIARAVLGTFDLDPASSDDAQATVQASAHFTVEDDGLTKPWHGRIWLNPPYSQPAISQFVEKLVAEYQAGHVTEAILLTHNYTDTSWFHAAASTCSAICFTRGRIAFLSPTGEKAAPTQGQAFAYFGENVEAFRQHFAVLGLVLVGGRADG